MSLENRCYSMRLRGAKCMDIYRYISSKYNAAGVFFTIDRVCMRSAGSFVAIIADDKINYLIKNFFSKDLYSFCND